MTYGRNTRSRVPLFENLRSSKANPPNGKFKNFVEAIGALVTTASSGRTADKSKALPRPHRTDKGLQPRVPLSRKYCRTKRQAGLKLTKPSNWLKPSHSNLPRTRKENRNAEPLESKQSETQRSGPHPEKKLPQSRNRTQHSTSPSATHARNPCLPFIPGSVLPRRGKGL
jgi:hypothetical protein